MLQPFLTRNHHPKATARLGGEGSCGLTCLPSSTTALPPPAPSRHCRQLGGHSRHATRGGPARTGDRRLPDVERPERRARNLQDPELEPNRNGRCPSNSYPAGQDVRGRRGRGDFVRKAVSRLAPLLASEPCLLTKCSAPWTPLQGASIAPSSTAIPMFIFIPLLLSARNGRRVPRLMRVLKPANVHCRPRRWRPVLLLLDALSTPVPLPFIARSSAFPSRPAVRRLSPPARRSAARATRSAAFPRRARRPP